MMLYCAVLFVLLSREKVAAAPKKIDAGVLVKLIHDINDDDYEGEDNFSLDLDHIKLEDNNAALPSLAKLVKKNHIANVAYTTNPDNNDYAVRIHVIENPHVLDQYKESLRKGRSTSSSSDDDSNDYDLRMERLLRRNAVFRLDESSDSIGHKQPELILRNGEDIGSYYTKNSGETDEIKKVKLNSIGNKKEEREVVRFDENEHDKSGGNDDWQSRPMKDEVDKDQYNDWNKPRKATKGVYERTPKDYKRNKKPENDWERDSSEKKQYVPRISDYYSDSKPKTHKKFPMKSFGRTSIPFVGKRGIYEDK